MLTGTKQYQRKNESIDQSGRRMARTPVFETVNRQKILTNHHGTTPDLRRSPTVSQISRANNREFGRRTRLNNTRISEEFQVTAPAFINLSCGNRVPKNENGCQQETGTAWGNRENERCD
jgi:hypothetical protein